MTFKTLVIDQGYANMPFGVRLTSAMAGAIGSDYGFALPAKPKFTIPALLSGLVNAVINWYEARATVRQLSSLDDRLLNDIGVERRDIEAVAYRNW